MFGFNFFEGVFWIVLGLIFFTIIYKQISKNYQGLSLVIGFLFLTFGVSDFVEINFNILPWWLWLWKIINFIGLIVVFIWYFKIKRKL